MEATTAVSGTGYASFGTSVVVGESEGRNSLSVETSLSSTPPPPTHTSVSSPESGSEEAPATNRCSPDPHQEVRQNVIIINTEESKGSTPDNEQWRSYGEHPLTAATAAMLNIQEQPTDMSALYDYYKIDGLSDIKQEGDHIIWSAPATVAANGLTPASHVRLTNDTSFGPDLARVNLITDQQTASELSILLISNSSKLELRESESPSDAGRASGPKVPDKIVKMSVVTSASSRNESDSEYGGSVIVNGGLVSSSSQETMMGSVINVSANSGGLLSHGLVKEEPKSPEILHDSPSPSHSPPGILGRSISRDLDSSVIVPNSSDHAKSLQATFGTHDFATTPYDHVTGFGGLNPTSQESLPPVSSPTGGSDSIYTLTSSDSYYRDYYTPPGDQYLSIRQQLGYPGGEPHQDHLFADRYIRPATGYKANSGGLTVDLPSPDSGIGADAITPRDHNSLQQNMDYQDLVSVNPGSQHNLINTDPSLLILPRGGQAGTPGPGRSRPWHDFGRQNEADKVQISKTYSNYGFRYFLESPISTSQRREDDRITYINKGQFYGITLEYIPDPEKPHLKSPTVKSIIMLMFREEKSPEDEIKAWQFWHGRQHSVKQRILDVDTKNSFGLVGCIEEVAHNAIAVYWNPMESVAKVNISVQCLSTDFSSQKGVKGLPLHVQIDTYEDPRDTTVHHRGYCQIKVFCDKGAERKTRDEERRAAKRRLSATGRKKMEDLYHPPCERSEFYTMTDRTKVPVLFTPSGDLEKQLPAIELSSFYGQGDESSSCGAGSRSDLGDVSPSPSNQVNGLLSPTTLKSINSSHNLKFHNLFPPSVAGEKRLCDLGPVSHPQDAVYPSMQKRSKLANGSNNDRLMLYVKQEEETAYTPLHLVPPSTLGLLTANTASPQQSWQSSCDEPLSLHNEAGSEISNQSLFYQNYL